RSDPARTRSRPTRPSPRCSIGCDVYRHQRPGGTRPNPPCRSAMTSTDPGRVVAIDPAAPDPNVIARAAAIIRNGGLVAFPTETVYGLGANGLDAVAVRRIFEAKRRALNDPVILHLASAEDVAGVASEVPPVAQALASRFWPGPL